MYNIKLTTNYRGEGIHAPDGAPWPHRRWHVYMTKGQRKYAGLHTTGIENKQREPSLEQVLYTLQLDTAKDLEMLLVWANAHELLATLRGKREAIKEFLGTDYDAFVVHDFTK